METMPQDISIENPQTLREVGIHLGTFSKQLEEIKATEKQHHADNQAANAAIIKKLDEINMNIPSRNEFNDLKKDVDSKANKWVENVLIYGGSAIGLALIGAILDLVLKH